MSLRILLSICFAATLSITAATPTINEINAAIRANDLAGLRQMVQSSETANLASGLSSTPLHYAAIYGSPEALRFLLEQGANPNTPNQSGATPLILAAWSFERTRLLVEHGASVNAAANNGITPLLVAAAAHGNLATVRYLLDKGANLQAQSKDGEDALLRCAFSGDTDMLQLLLKRGADPKHADKAGATALINATNYPDSARVQTLLRAGSDPNAFNTFGGMVKNGPIALVHLTPLMLAASSSDQATITALLQAGARVNEKDSRNMTPLMLSIATDHAQPATVRQLMAAGADLQATDKYGDSALDWARKFGNPEIISMLVNAGATGRDLPAAPVPPSHGEALNPTESMGRALTLFGRSDFFRVGGGCAGCHHQPAHARAYAAARTVSLTATTDLRRAFIESEVANRPRFAQVLPYLTSFGGDADTVLALMTANLDLNEPSNEFLDLIVHFLAERQDPSGAWISLGVARPPLEESTISRTAQEIEVLKHYSWPARQAEFDLRIQKARVWLQHAVPETTYEEADRIRGLHAAGVSSSDLQADAARLCKSQHSDGGWAQTRYLSSDAYATGIVLDTLFKAGLLTDPAFRKGVAFLLRTQFPDGSWYVRSRAPKFQPYFQSGMPFDHDQWISSLGTAWAVMALSHASAADTASIRRTSIPAAEK